ncbi:hypothetical protein [Nostoc sp.]
MPQDSQYGSDKIPPPAATSLKSYGVHTSLKIQPNAWFRHLPIGFVRSLT